MMDWTDRHCRFFHRLMSSQTLLYTEMVTAPALVRGRAHHLLAFNHEEHPLALQLGGSDPKELAEAAKMGADVGYDEINLNVGCPSDRVQSGSFGAILMETPHLVAECVAAMQAACPVEVTVKCRIGVDDQDPQTVLPDFLTHLQNAGISRVTIHARKAWLKGLSPKENRDIPPLDYDLVYAMKQTFPKMHISLNGGITDLDQAQDMFAQGIDGVMIGRAAYHTPADVLLNADACIYGKSSGQTAPQIVQAMLPYIERHLGEGGRLHNVTRHMLGLFTGRPGARGWRRVLSEGAHRHDATSALLLEALDRVVGGDIHSPQKADIGTPSTPGHA
ncbi:UNVERIFIED_CONTAM: hypothetical protein GTU68_055353 [Idotea baltica]|nr:hypothetical protein [Idotea baltica]